MRPSYVYDMLSPTYQDPAFQPEVFHLSSWPTCKEVRSRWQSSVYLCINICNIFAVQKLTIIIFIQFSLCYVNIRTDNNLTDSSTKIEEIVQTISSLREKDPSVKIIIFSHWANILKTIETVLAESDISYRSQLTKFHLTIKEFKVNKRDSYALNICNLMILRFSNFTLFLQ